MSSPAGERASWPRAAPETNTHPAKASTSASSLRADSRSRNSGRLISITNTGAVYSRMPATARLVREMVS